MGAGTSAGDAARARSATAADAASDTPEPQADVPGEGHADATGAKSDAAAGGRAQHRKPDTATPDPAKSVAANPDPTMPDPVKPDPVKPDAVKPEPAKPGGTKKAPAKPGGTRMAGAAQSGERGPLAPQPAAATALPAITEGTVPPEGAGRAAPRDAPAPVRQWPMISVLSLTGLGLAVVGVHPFADAFRIGTILIGVALIGAALLRWALPSVGMLAVRSRFTDLVTYGLLGVVIVLLAMMEQPNPWIEIPFLEDVVHSTVS